MSESFFSQLFYHSEQISPSLKGDIGEIDSTFIHASNDNLSLYQKLYTEIAELNPEAGKSYWRNSIWGLLCWQPLYIAFISIYGFRTLPKIDGIAQTLQPNYVAGYRFTNEEHIHGDETELINIAGDQLNHLFETYREELSQLIKVPKGLTSQLFSDGILTCLEQLKDNFPDIENAYIQHQASIWLDSCDLPSRYVSHLYERRNKLKLVRAGCCLVYKYKHNKHCVDCPKKSKNKKRLKKIKESCKSKSTGLNNHYV